MVSDLGELTLKGGRFISPRFHKYMPNDDSDEEHQRRLGGTIEAVHGVL